jgi:hypothetical protein
VAWIFTESFAKLIKLSQSSFTGCFGLSHAVEIAPRLVSMWVFQTPPAVFFRDLIMTLLNRHLFSMSWHKRMAVPTVSPIGLLLSSWVKQP